MTKQLKVGDKVILKEAVITNYYCTGGIDKEGHFQITFDDKTTTSVFGCQIETIIPAPWEPKVGDNVFYVQRRYYDDKHHCPHDGVTFLGAHSDPGLWETDIPHRKWAIVAYKGDIPHGIYYEDLRKEKPE